MPQGNTVASPAATAVSVIITVLVMGGMVVTYVIMLIALWRGMKAHEKIAAKLAEIADKLQLK